ncbi:MAG: serine/threonine protein kinase [Myxococcales bacterium]|nr:serine/threonine protein kinase [Myxococcales bacterium]
MKGPDPGDGEAFEAFWRRCDGDTLARGWVAGTTLGGSAGELPADGPALPPLALEGGAGAAEYALGPVIGEGGVAVVLSARQLPLEREVALKCLRAERAEAGATLVREARLAGALEHPNIVPVHALGAGPDGAPVLVMKRVEGAPWSELLADAEHPLWAAVGDATLAPNLSIFLQICRAVHFAHDRGVVHLDLKPENVMVGAYGEVYVVDWGLARRVPPGVDGVEHRGAPLGTPGYMAPEMLGGGGRLGRLTDVYLLGAVLHRVLAGAPRHTGATLRARLESAHRSAPFDFPPDVPAPLAALANAATAADPAARPPSVDALRRAVEDFLAHRTSMDLADEAAARAASLEAALAAGDAEAIDERFAACRYGFDAALRIWPGNEAARAGLQRVVERMIEHDLAQGDPRSAARLLPALPEARPALAARVEDAAARAAGAAAELVRLRAVERAHDARLGLGVRRVTLPIMLFVLGVMPVVVGLLRADDLLLADPGPLRRAVAPVVVGLFAFAVLRWRWRRAGPLNLYNRRLLGLLLVTTVGLAVSWLAAHLEGTPLPTTVVRNMQLVTIGLACSAVTFERRLVPAAMLMGVGSLVAARWPAYAEVWVGLANTLGFVVTVGLWRRMAPADAQPG